MAADPARDRALRGEKDGATDPVAGPRPPDARGGSPDTPGGSVPSGAVPGAAEHRGGLALGALVEALPEAVLVIDSWSVVRGANSRARAMLGGQDAVASPEDALEDPLSGRNILDLLNIHGLPGSAPGAQWSWGSAAELRADLKGAEERRLALLSSAIHAPIEGYVVVLRDIGAEERRITQRIAEERLAAIAQLAAGVAHEFNNIMASLYGFAQLARQDAQFQDELVQAVEQYAERSREVTRRLRSFSMDQTGPLAAVDLVELIDGVLGKFEPELARARIRVTRRFYKVPPTLLNRREMEEVFASLLEYARQAIVQNGEVIIEVCQDSRPSGGEAILVTVSDSSYGIPRESLTRVFEPFFTLKQTASEGAAHGGLGLAIAYNYVRRVGGEISVDSELGKGTTFAIRLPVRVERRKQQAEIAVDRRRGAAAPVRNILAVDDEDVILRLLEALLSEHHMIPARTGREAMAALRKGPFDYVILDLLLPGEFDGFAVFDEIHKRDPQAKIILLTGRIEDDKVREYAARAYGYLRKPFGIKDIATMIV